MSKIIGVTVGTPVPQSDWNQTNPNRADYIKNKPVVDQEFGADSENAQSGKAVAQAVGELARETDSKYTKVSSRTSSLDKRVTNLEQGIVPSPFETDNTVAYRKDVPANALPFAEVSMVGGMTRKCTNLWDNANAYFSYNSAFTRTETGFVFDRSKITAGQYASYTIPMKKGVTYHFYANTLQSASAAQLYLYADKVYGTVLKSVSAGNKILTYTADADYPTARFVYIITSGTPSITVENIMVYVGDSNVPDYEPYFEGLRSAPVTEVESVGANLLPYPYAHTTKTENGITFTDNGDGSISAVGTATAATYFFLAQNTNFGDTNIFASQIDSPLSKNGYTLKHCDYNSSNKRVYITVANGTTVNKTFYPMLNKGETALPYSPYFRNTLPIPQEVQALDGYGEGVNESVYNYIDWEKKQFVKRVGDKVLNGTEVWSMYNNNMVTEVFDNRSPNDTPIVCDCVYEAKMGWGTNRFIVYTNGEHTVESWKAYLATNPMTVKYVMTTLETTDISALLPEDNFIGVGGGGTVTMVNEHQYSVPSSITYQVKGDA